MSRFSVGVTRNWDDRRAWPISSWACALLDSSLLSDLGHKWGVSSGRDRKSEDSGLPVNMFSLLSFLRNRGILVYQPMRVIPFILTNQSMRAIPSIWTNQSMRAIPSILTNQSMRAIPCMLTNQSMRAILSMLTNQSKRAIPSILNTQKKYSRRFPTH